MQSFYFVFSTVPSQSIAIFFVIYGSNIFAALSVENSFLLFFLTHKRICVVNHHSSGASRVHKIVKIFFYLFSFVFALTLVISSIWAFYHFTVWLKKAFAFQFMVTMEGARGFDEKQHFDFKLKTIPNHFIFLEQANVQTKNEKKKNMNWINIFINKVTRRDTLHAHTSLTSFRIWLETCYYICLWLKY